MASPRVRLRTTDVELILQFAVAGRGIAILPAFIANAELEAGRLVAILDAFRPPHSAVYALTVSRKHLPAKTRRCIEFLVERLPGLMA